jgi:uncharacterized protein YdhG (YjbR/CyaY superfamily)
MNNVNDYIQSIPDDRLDRFLSVHHLILKLYADATVDMSYKMPTYRAGDGWAALANQRNYISLYTCGASHPESYKQQYPQQKTGKGCINFRDSDEIHYDDLELAIRHAIKFVKKPELGNMGIIRHD